MTNNQDARPFVDLKKDAEEFREKIDEDVTECMDFLDKKITDLICDPDSLSKSMKSIPTNPLVEFSKAKYDIFMSVKSLINTKEREWISYISEMKKLFIENVEIFLAGTKLEVKLPSTEYQSSFGSRKSPGNRKSLSSSVTSTILNTFTKNIPGLGSPRYKEESSRNTFEESNVGDKVQFNRRGRLSASSAKLYESSASKSAVDEIDEMDFDIDDYELNLSRSRRSSSVKSRKSSSSDLNTSLTRPVRRGSLKQNLNGGLPGKNVSASENQIDTTESKAEFKKPRSVLKPKQAGIKVNSKKSSSDENEENIIIEKNNQVPIKGRRGRAAAKSKVSDPAEFKKPRPVLKPKQAGIKVNSKKSNSDENKENNIIEKNNQVPIKGRRGRAAAKSKVSDPAVDDLKSSFTDKSENNEQADKISTQAPVKARRGRAAKSANIDDSTASNVKTSSSDEDEKKKTIVTNQMPSRATRGRAATKNKTNSSAISKVTSNSSEEKEKNDEDEENINHVPLKTTRGKAAIKNKASNSTSSNVKSSTSDEEEKITAITTNQMPMKAPRGRAAAKNKTNRSAVSKVDIDNSSDDKDNKDEDEENINHEPLKKTRGKATGKNKASNSTMEETRNVKNPRGRSAASQNNENVPVQTTRGRRAGKAGGIPETVSSRSPQKDYDDSDDMVLPTPLSRPSTSSIRRKTLLPNLVDLSDNEIIPGNPTRSIKSKRKTFATPSDLQAALPSKRLKVSSKKTFQVEEDDEAAADNLLANDDSYSEWMALKAVDGKVPPHPGIYEMKVWRAKKPAYIGDCESLRQKLTLHKLKHNSGHKHLDKFVERNFDEIQVRYEVVSSVSEAKEEAKNRIKNFVSQNKTTPAYN